MIRLYRAPWSTNVERVALALAQKGVEAPPPWIDYADRSLVEEVSGQPLVPVIDFDGEIVFDSTRILRRLEELHPEPPLFPTDPSVRAELEIFLEWFDEVWKGPPNEIEAELAKPEPDAARIEALAGSMIESLDGFERMLAGHDYLMGDELTAADLCAFPFLKFAALHDPADDELFHVILRDHQRDRVRPRLNAWIGRVDGRPRA